MLKYLNPQWVIIFSHLVFFLSRAPVVQDQHWSCNAIMTISVIKILIMHVGVFVTAEHAQRPGPRWKRCMPHYRSLCRLLSSDRLRCTVVTWNDPSHPCCGRARWIHTFGHLKFPPTLHMNHLKCQPNSSTSCLLSPKVKGETVSMETTSESLFFLSELRAVLSLFCRCWNTQSVFVCFYAFIRVYLPSLDCCV